MPTSICGINEQPLSPLLIPVCSICPHWCLNSHKNVWHRCHFVLSSGHLAWSIGLWEMFIPEKSHILKGNGSQTYLVHPSLLLTPEFHRCRALLSGRLGLQGQAFQEDLKEKVTSVTHGTFAAGLVHVKNAPFPTFFQGAIPEGTHGFPKAG